MKYKKGDHFYMLTPDLKKCTIVNVFKDSGIELVVYKIYWKQKRRWDYYTEMPSTIDIIRISND